MSNPKETQWNTNWDILINITGFNQKKSVFETA